MKYRAVCKYLGLLGTATALPTPAWPTALQPGNRDTRAVQRGLENVLAATKHQAPGPQREHTGCAKQAAAATMHPEQRLIPLDCACSFGSVIPLSAVRSKKAFSLPGGPCGDLPFHPAPPLILSAWVTVPPFGWQRELQPHFTLKFLSAVGLRVK